MKLAIYTSFAINYLAKARVLVASIKAINPEIAVIGLVNDRFPVNINPANEAFDEIWFVDDYPSESINSWIFEHNIMELSTAVKGWALVRLLGRGYDYVMYLDPDCWVLEDPTQITEMLSEGTSVAVVPHTTRPADTAEEIRIIETSSLKHGIYNLGFLLVRNDEDGNRLAKWWASRLDKFCIDDFETGLFTDQRWFDLAVGYFDFVKVLRHAGIDVASWNVGQRTLVRAGAGYLIDGDPLIFYHFSGVGPAGVHRWVREKFAPSDPLVAELEFRYEELIGEQGQKELAKIRPFYDLYSDGSLILASDRKFYRTTPELIAAFPNPFDVSQQPNFRTHAITVRPPEEELGDAKAAGRILPRKDKDLEIRARNLFEGEVYRWSTASPIEDEDALWELFLKDAWNPVVRANRYFDPTFYFPSVSEEDRRSYASPFHHYIDKGIESGVSPSWVYDDSYYLSEYSEIAEAVRTNMIGCGFEHFSRFGWREGRSGCAFFNERSYLENNDDVAEAIANGVLLSGEEHYARFGSREGRAV